METMLNKEPQYCQHCGFELVDIGQEQLICTTPECPGTIDPDSIPILKAHEQAAINIRHYAEIQQEIDRYEKMRELETRSVNEHYDEKVRMLRHQQEFWANPLERYLRQVVQLDPKAKKSIDASAGTAKLSPTREKVEIDADLNADDFNGKPFVGERTSYYFKKTDLLAYIKETGETFDGIEIIPADFNFSIKLKE